MAVADLSRALAVAIAAAEEAGAMIRADFHRPGGPRGYDDHADVDTEAEYRIRARLTHAFPDWGYRGEETGSSPMEPPPRYVWLVDPNDGTRSYLEGYRGSSVSIALLRDREPVLGVVYAPCAPDSAGDMIAWADGCGPMLRNGQPVMRTPWPAEIGPHDEILVSQGESNHRAHLDYIAPGRFRQMNSIAYRLALAAAGDATAAASFHGAGDWDYAAGQALLRAVDADLFHGNGHRAAYSSRGESHGFLCFGSTENLAHSLTERQAARSHHRLPQEPPFPYWLRPVRLERGAAVADPDLLGRAQGCLLGQLAGDALGSRVEFQSAHEIRSRHPQGIHDLVDGGTWNTMAGQPTDDSELALVLARSLVRSVQYDPDTAALAYSYWLQSGPFDVGATTAQALRGAPPVDVHAIGTAPAGVANALMAAASRTSQANGSLMRVSPLGIWGYAQSAGQLANAARLDSRLTHPHPVCQEACAVYVVTLAHAIKFGGTPGEIYRVARDWATTSCSESTVSEAVTAAEHALPTDFESQQGWVLIALQNAFYQLLHAIDAAAGIEATVMAGGDTDTNAAIAGALLGAAHGRDAIPWPWRRLILSCRPLTGLRGIHQPRPEAFWPVDALELAERLLLAGARAK